MEEKEHVSRCLQGEAEDFKAIVDKYKAQAMAMALNILGNREDAEDACQEAFLQVYRNLEKFNPGMSFKNWLYTILYRRCLDQLKKKRRFSLFLTKLKSGSLRLSSPESSNPSQKRPLPQNILNCLSPKEKTVLCLWADEGYTAEEISRIMGCKAATARVCLFNARKKVKSFLEK